MRQFGVCSCCCTPCSSASLAPPRWLRVSWGCPAGHRALVHPRAAPQENARVPRSQTQRSWRDFLCRLCCSVRALWTGEERNQNQGRGGDGTLTGEGRGHQFPGAEPWSHPREEGQEEICYESGLITTSSFPPGWSKWTRKLY